MAVSPRSYRKKLKGDHALVVSEELHAKVVKCLKRYFTEVGLVNLGKILKKYERVSTS